MDKFERIWSHIKEVLWYVEFKHLRCLALYDFDLITFSIKRSNVVTLMAFCDVDDSEPTNITPLAKSINMHDNIAPLDFVCRFLKHL